MVIASAPIQAFTAAADDTDDLADKDLDTLEREIRIHQMSAASHGERAVLSALEIGKRLAAAKRQLKHGEFLSWAEDRFGYNRRHSARLLKLAANGTHVSHLLMEDPTLSLRGALAAVDDKLKEEREPAPGRIPLDVAVTLPWHIDIRQLDADDPPQEWDGTGDLVVTSWPYGVNEKRQGYVDIPSFAEWQLRANDWAAALVRILKPNGRVCLVLPVTVRQGGPRALAAWGNVILNGAGLRYQTTIEWPKSDGGQTSNSVARGSVDSPNALSINTGAEQILVYHRGEWNLGRAGEPCDLDHNDWLEWTNGLWTISGCTDPKGYPCVFPEELAKRLIQCYSFPGDTVIDLHCGSGTVPFVATQLGRHFKGGDINPEAVKRSQARVATITGKA